MKIYTRKNEIKTFLFVALGLDLLGIVLFIFAIILEKDLITIISSIVVFILLSLIFWVSYFIVRKSTIIIDNDSITFHNHIFITKIKYNKKTGLIIYYKDIKSINKTYQKGDMILTADTNFYNIELNDGKNITFTLFSFGKEQEKQIYNELLAKVNKK